jgi:hypothetical protein
VQQERAPERQEAVEPPGQPEEQVIVEHETDQRRSAPAPGESRSGHGRPSRTR